jgi:hypothetical protein
MALTVLLQPVQDIKLFNTTQPFEKHNRLRFLMQDFQLYNS